MSESDKSKRKAYIRQLREAVGKGEELLSEVGKIELQRRKNTVRAILDAAIPIFEEERSLDEQDRDLEKATTKWVWAFGLGIVGYVFYEYLKVPFGSFLIFCAACIAIHHAWVLFLVGRAKSEAKSAIDDFRYRWLENGGDEDSFSKLNNMIYTKGDDFSTNADEYSEWYCELEADFLDSIHGSLNYWRRPYSYP